MFGFRRQRTNAVTAAAPEQPQRIIQQSHKPLTEREQLLRQQYERLANRHAMAEAEDHARHQQQGLH